MRYFFFSIGLIFFSLLPVRAEAPPPSPVFIEEVAWAGSPLSQADEWLELANASDATTTLAGWSIRGAGTTAIHFPDDAVIAPRGTYLLANDRETDASSALGTLVHLATTTVSLSNSALQIELIDPAGLVVDRAGEGGAPPAGTSSPKASMIRVTTSTIAWRTATSSIGFKTIETMPFGELGVCAICVMTAPMTEIASSTDPVETATSTQTEVPVTETTSTTPEIPPEVPPPVQTAPPPPPLTISLSEAVSNPAAGPEWVELRIAETTATATDRALELWDAAGKMMTIAPHTPLTAPGYLVVPLASARLNNGGDDLSLREAGGVTIALTHIPSLEDGVAWARTDGGTWVETDVLTPNAPNQFPVPAPPDPPKIKESKPVPETTTATTTTVTIIPTGPTLHILLNEAMSAPVAGSEWVELWIADGVATATDRVLELWDGSGEIATIPRGTGGANGTVLVTLTSARLNNGGDELTLREAGGNVTLDATDIPSLKKGISWARDETGEWADADPTPGMPNPPPAADAEPAPSLQPDENTASDDPSSSLSDLSDADMTQPPAPNARVRLVGTVGSVPRLLGATHAFILLGEDGRAAIVYLPKHLHTPSFGATIRVMGSLTSTERQLELRMKTSDVWTTIATSTPPQPREMDFLAPAAEDAWSLVQASGTVRTVGTKSFSMESDGTELTISVPTAVGYRTKRLTVGDTVGVTGLFDLRKESPTILVRVPEDIVLEAHAPESVTPPSPPTSKNGLPNWLPFGAAAGAVAATGAAKRLRAFFKRRKLEAMAAKT